MFTDPWHSPSLSRSLCNPVVIIISVLREWTFYLFQKIFLHVLRDFLPEKQDAKKFSVQSGQFPLGNKATFFDANMAENLGTWRWKKSIHEFYRTSINFCYIVFLFLWRVQEPDEIFVWSLPRTGNHSAHRLKNANEYIGPHRSFFIFLQHKLLFLPQIKQSLEIKFCCIFCIHQILLAEVALISASDFVGIDVILYGNTCFVSFLWWPLSFLYFNGYFQPHDVFP